MANQSGGSSLLRDYRKGNWTVQETMVLIEAKKMDDERRMKRVEESEGRSKPAELRWKWVEDYCWRNGCWRSQNQCNDKWDNLMRDFKKVRDYERRLAEKVGGGGDTSGGGGGGGGGGGSYWKIEKHERKERNLPSNMLPQIYEALVEVVERRGVRVVVGAGSSGGGGGGGSNVGHSGYVVERSTSNVVVQPPLLLPPLQHSISAPPQTVLSLPPPPPPPPPPPSPVAATQPHSLPQSQPLPTVDSDTSEHSDSPAKRRRRGEGTSGTAASGSTSNIEVGNAISQSATLIAEAIQACDEREDTRHRELLSLYQRRLEIEESKTEITRQGIDGLVDAINKLSNSILALAKQKN